MENITKEGNILPDIDIFINPQKDSELKYIVDTMMNSSREYFSRVNMELLYPELFRALWHYTLPCFPQPGVEHAMLRSCTVGQENIPCEQMFRRVPTDSGRFFSCLSSFFLSIGMCCAMNSDVTFKDTLFGGLVTEAQDEKTEKRKVTASSGLRAGVSLVLDMYSNRASFGTIADTSSAFSVFIGSSTEFPVLKEDRIAIEPGKEHFLKLSGQVSRIFKETIYFL